MGFIDEIKAKAKTNKKTIVLPETEDIRTYEAAEAVLREGTANLVLVGSEEEITRNKGSFDISGAKIVDPATSEKTDAYIAKLVELRQKKGMTEEQQRVYLESVRRSRFKTLIMTAHIDTAVEEIERRRRAAGREVEYKAFELYFMQGMEYAEIAEKLETGKNTPRRWVTAIINELSVLLWGIDEERARL